MKKKKSIAIYVAISVIAVFVIVIAALFGGVGSNNRILSDYGFLNEKGDGLNREVTIYGDSEIDVFSGVKRIVSEIRITADIGVKSIEVLIKANGFSDKSLGVVRDTNNAVFKNGYTLDTGEEFIEPIEVAGALNFDTGKYLSGSEISGNRIVIKIKTDKDAKISVELIGEIKDE